MSILGCGRASATVVDIDYIRPERSRCQKVIGAVRGCLGMSSDEFIEVVAPQPYMFTGQ